VPEHRNWHLHFDFLTKKERRIYDKSFSSIFSFIDDRVDPAG
jgi:hypothetical protein